MSGKYIRVLSVAPLEDYRLAVSLSNGKKGVFDVSPYLDSGVFRKLKNRDYFSQVRVFGNSGIGWPGGLSAPDLSGDTLDYEMRPAQKSKRLRPIASPSKAAKPRRRSRLCNQKED